MLSKRNIENAYTFLLLFWAGYFFSADDPNVRWLWWIPAAATLAVLIANLNYYQTEQRAEFRRTLEWCRNNLPQIRRTLEYAHHAVNQALAHDAEKVWIGIVDRIENIRHPSLATEVGALNHILENKPWWRKPPVRRLELLKADIDAILGLPDAIEKRQERIRESKRYIEALRKEIAASRKKARLAIRGFAGERYVEFETRIRTAEAKWTAADDALRPERPIDWLAVENMLEEVAATLGGIIQDAETARTIAELARSLSEKAIH